MLYNDLPAIAERLSFLEALMTQTEENHLSQLQDLHPDQKEAARNLLCYLSLRSEDIRNLQDALHENGLSSLASSESHIKRQLQSIQERMGKQYAESELATCSFTYAKNTLGKKINKLFGPKVDPGIPHIMVTLDKSFAGNYSFIKNLLLNGMNIARVNCAHDDESVWSQMIHAVRKAFRNTGLSCKIYMDLAGPKLRTKLIGKGRKKGEVKVHEGQLIFLAENNSDYTDDDIVISPTEKGIVSLLKKGERVYFDDGVIKGIVEKVRKGRAGIRILRVSSQKKVIKNGKGINFPDSMLKVAALTEFDRTCLHFASSHADLIGYSFVQQVEDIRELNQALSGLPGPYPDLILKIETAQAVRNLPFLLLEAMKRNMFGVMIARGDLAVEIGFERMSEIQEEILWICESAHVPVVWATQVLETLNKSGMATRSEITDAAHAAMADCVMVNKGDHTIEVIETLKNILQRIGGHHIKKRFTFRPLAIAQNFFHQK